MIKAQGTQVSVFRFLIVGAAFVKIVNNYKELMANKLFALYFTILLLGGIISFSAQVYLVINSSNPDYNTVSSHANTIEVIGVIFIDVFFGLMPNLFYSIYKTKLTEAGGKFTKRYFYINGIVMLCMFVAIMVSAIASNEDQSVIITNVFLYAIVTYSLCFYLVVIHVLRTLEGRVRKIIRRYFGYYSIYALAMYFRNSFLIGGALTQANPALMEISFANFPVDTINAGVTLMVVVLFLKEIKFAPASEEKKEQSKDASTKSDPSS